MFTVDDASVPYSWNHTITYNHNLGRMPFLVETLQATAIEATYRPLDEILEYKIHAVIGKGNVTESRLFLNKKRSFHLFGIVVDVS